MFYQVKYRLTKPAYKPYDASPFKINDSVFKICPIGKYSCLRDEMFSFLNLEHAFEGWNFTENGMLWAYNQNYFDWINQTSFAKEEGCKWIDKFIEELPCHKVGLDPYPTALRSINWVKFFSNYPDCATETRLNSLYSQLKLLEKKLEYHLLGNHLLEDAYALYIGAAFFNDGQMLIKASKLLRTQLAEQVLPDGAHFEQSPMYHCILLDRLLDCINIKPESELVDFATKMLGHLESIVWSDNTIPLMNDAANGIAPPPEQIFDYARRLGLRWEAIPLKESGYRKMTSEAMEAIVDVGNITATYQPGHTHADTFNYELRIDGKPFVVDTGISTYNKTERRQLERSTKAHNCIVVDGRNSSEVWGGFRVGKRANVEIAGQARNEVAACHDGFGKPCKRRFEMTEKGFTIEDWYDGEAVSYVHLAEDADEHRVSVEGAISIDVKPWQYSVKYNEFLNGKVMVIRFNNHIKYTIR